MTDEQLEDLLTKVKASYHDGELDGLQVSERLRQRVRRTVQTGPVGRQTLGARRGMRWSGWWTGAGAVGVALVLLAVFAHQVQPSLNRRATQHYAPMVQAPIAQILKWNTERRLYEILWPPGASHGYTKVIFLLPNGFTIPRTFSAWPPKGFSPVAVLNDPAAELRTGTGTIWFNLQTSLYWLRPASSKALPSSLEVSDLGSSAKKVLAVSQGRLFAVAWPTLRHPGRTIFLRSDSFSMPTEITAWPAKNFRVVGIYPASVLDAHTQLVESSYPDPPHLLVVRSGVRIPASSLTP